MQEIERKFLIETMPDISGVTPWHSERYFIKNENGFEERISRLQNKFFYYKKTVISSIQRKTEKKEITEKEFNNLKHRAYGSTIRDTYLLSENPKLTLQIYHGHLEGLIRAEVEFSSVEEANAFNPLSWMGKEITGLDIARDSTILNKHQ